MLRQFIETTTYNQSHEQSGYSFWNDGCTILSLGKYSKLFKC